MGNTQSTSAAEATASRTKLTINRLADEYLSFIESTTVEIGKSLLSLEVFVVTYQKYILIELKLDKKL